MEQVIAYLDTQNVVWLVSSDRKQFTGKARRLINSAALFISPMVGLELQYLHEIGRLRLGAADILEKLRREIDLRVCNLPFFDVTSIAFGEGWTRDPFDRMIVAHAKSNAVSPLITSDEKIRANYINAIW